MKCISSCKLFENQKVIDRPKAKSVSGGNIAMHANAMVEGSKVCLNMHQTNLYIIVDGWGGL